MLLTPPVLPSFLSDAFELKAVDGVPGDDEVKAVHSVMRALNNVANMSNLYDEEVAMKLSQHLFNLQMARYRDRYPCNMFPSQITTYTPPTLPAHIPVALQAVVGSPLDEQVKAAQAALRFSENFASTPFMFDANLSMDLSQHLFDLQFERYLRQMSGETPVATAESLTSRPDTSSPYQTNNPIDLTPMAVVDEPDPASSNYSIRSSTRVNDASGGSQAESVMGSQRPTNPVESPARQYTRDNSDCATAGIGETNQLLSDIKHFMVVSQNVMAKGLNSYNPSGYPYPYHYLVNEKGEYPELAGLPALGSFSYGLANNRDINDDILAQYLRFYNLDDDFVEEGEVLGIKADKKNQAKSRLRSFLLAY